MNELSNGNVVLNNWSDTIDVTLDYFNAGAINTNVGNWSNIIDEFDPFKDGKSAYRMGKYLHSLLEGLNNGIDRDILMDDVAQKYMDQWGYDKIIFNN